MSIKTGKVVLPAKVIGLDPQNDLALLQVDVKYLPLLKVEGKLAALPLEQDLRKVALGDKVFTVGFPLTDTQGLNPKLTEGSISSLSGIQDHPGELKISCQIPITSFAHRGDTTSLALVLRCDTRKRNWWRRWELNPRPKQINQRHLHA